MISPEGLVFPAERKPMASGSGHIVTETDYTLKLECDPKTFDHWVINWGDESADVTVKNTVTSLTHKYKAPGYYSIKYRVVVSEQGKTFTFEGPPDSVEVVNATVHTPTPAIQKHEVTAKHVSFTWTASAPKYFVLRDGVLKGVTKETHYEDTDVIPSKTYVYTVQATSENGDSEPSAPLKITVPAK